jgi:hypothetical protein
VITGVGDADHLTLGGSVVLDGAFTAAEANLTRGADATVASGASLTVDDAFSLADYANLAVAGTTTVSNALVEGKGNQISVSSGGTLAVGAVAQNGNAGSYMVSGGVFTDQGDFSGDYTGVSVDGGAFTVGGAATLGHSWVSASGSGTIALASLANTADIGDALDNVFIVDPSSSIEIGGASAALGGQFVLDNGQTLSGGGWITAPEIVINGSLEVQSGDSETLYGALSGGGTAQIDANATLTLDKPKGAGGAPAILFNGSGAGLGLSAATLASGQLPSTIQNFVAGDTIDLSGLGGASVQSSGIDGDGNLVVQIAGAQNGVDVTDQLTFAGTTLEGTISVTDSADGTYVETSVICFCPGTLIRTPDGEAAVEDLRRGDLVLTSAGESRPVSWIGVRAIATRFADPLRCWPIRVKAGALDENVPARDLLLSPDHALLVGGVLIHAGALVNGVSILRETEVSELFTYYHVELDDHALILAENAPAETFVDNVDRLGFDNWAEHEALWPEGKPIVEMPYPRAKAHRQVPAAVRALIAARAQVANPATAAA